jgi:hypothetical protein
VTWFTILATSGSVIWVQGGTNVAVSELGLHPRRVCFFLAMRGESPPEHLKRRMKYNFESVRDRIQAQLIVREGVASGFRARACTPENMRACKGFSLDFLALPSVTPCAIHDL